MKMSRILALILAVTMLSIALTACRRPNNDEISTEGLEGTYNITMWVSEKEGIATQFKEQIDAFEAKNPGIIVNAQIEGVAEGESGSKVIADVATAPDIYCFAQDQLARLVQAAALAAPPAAIAESIKSENDEDAVSAASVAGTVYAYPMTSDNGYFMYYDKSIISDEDAESLEKIIAACEKNKVKFRYALENAWYTASFFFATGCHSTWSIGADGTFSAVDDTFNSDEGLIAMKGMQKLVKSPCYDSNADIFTDAGVVISGTWTSSDAMAHFGDDLGITDLPSFEVDGKSYHLGSFKGNKLMGVKPQSDPKRTAVLSLLAEYLTGEECQKQRFESFEWGPSNKVLQKSNAVRDNPMLAALAKQSEYAQLQGQIHGAWWDIARILGADAKAAKSEGELRTALNEYETAIKNVVSASGKK